MKSNIIYKIRHKETGKWKWSGLEHGFTDNAIIAGEWRNLSAVKALFTKMDLYRNEYPRMHEWYDLENWEIVSFRVILDEAGTIQYADLS